MTTFRELIILHPIINDAINFSYYKDHKDLEQERKYLDSIIWLIKNTMKQNEEISITIQEHDVMLMKISIGYMRLWLGEKSWDIRQAELNELEAFLDTIEFNVKK